MNELHQAHTELLALFPGLIVSMDAHIGNYTKYGPQLRFSLCVSNDGGDFNTVATSEKSIEDLMLRAKHYARTINRTINRTSQPQSDTATPAAS